MPSIGLVVLCAATVAPPSGDSEVVTASLAPDATPPALPGWAEGRTIAMPDRLDALDEAAAYAAPIPPQDDRLVSCDALALPRWTASTETNGGDVASAQTADALVDATESTPSDEPAAPTAPSEAPVLPAEPVAVAPAQPEPQPVVEPAPQPATSIAIERRALLQSASRWISRYEGSSRTAYFDHRGNRTVGIGCNLDAGDGDERLAAVDADYASVRAGDGSLSDAQVARLFARDLSHAVREAEKLVPDLYEHPPAVRVLVVDLVYTAGPTGFCRFRSTRAALAAHDYAALAVALPQTRWYRQVHDRARAHLAALRALTPEG